MVRAVNSQQRSDSDRERETSSRNRTIDLERHKAKHRWQKRAVLQRGDASKGQQAFALLPPQDMQVGGQTFHNVPFVTPVGSAQNIPDREEDGLLPTMLFQRVYISFADHYVIVDPRWDGRPRR